MFRMGLTIFVEDTHGMTVRKLFAEKNDPACFEELVVRYLPKMKKAAEEECPDNVEDQEELYSMLCLFLVELIRGWEESEENRLKYGHFSTKLGLLTKEHIKWHWRKPRERASKFIANEKDDVYIVDDLDFKIAAGNFIKEMGRHLNQKERNVLYYRYNDQLSLDDVGKIYNVGKERIRQIEAKALRKFRSDSGRSRIYRYSEV